ncbi:MAG: mercury resistance system periplasmic binding protein MerP [Rhodoferax sp.]|nr:mercury resistance system periplasmic binding protein MerP [Rhodoferax sp.]
MKKLLTLIAACFGTMSAWAAPATVTLSVPTMDCPVCPITVKKALVGVPGVAKASVDFDRRLATVHYDDIRTNVGALMQATANAGYPSTRAKADRP